MGRRSRQREAAGVQAPAAPEPHAPPRDPRRRARLEEAPKAPWHPLPLVELAVVVGLVLMVAGFVADDDRRRATLIGIGLVLASLAGLEVAMREHLTGFRSHTLLLTIAAGVLTGVPVGFLLNDRYVGVAVIVLVGAAAYVVLRRVFQRRSGGLTWRA